MCFLYGTWFGVSALAEAGEAEGQDAPRLAAAARFVLRMQRGDGGWGETYRACVTREPEFPQAGKGTGGGSTSSSSSSGEQSGARGGSNAVSTAWALMALMRAGCTDEAAVRRGIGCLLRLQEPSGDWPQGPCSGIFNRVCGITYTSYRNVFPLWALGMFESRYKA